MDILLVLLAAPVVVPVVIVLAMMLSSDGCNPFYRQKRVGRNGRNFTMWKLRTMVPDAEQKLEQHLESNEAIRREWDVKQKLSDDPRITPLGNAIRKCSIDELPQLWNVLIGDMSLVGPRPMMPQQSPLYRGLAYFELRPGLSGFWQVSDRNNTSFASRAEFDESYNQCLSLKTDLWVLFRTIAVVFKGSGC